MRYIEVTEQTTKKKVTIFIDSIEFYAERDNGNSGIVTKSGEVIEIIEPYSWIKKQISYLTNKKNRPMTSGFQQ
jgi:hypothetical protein